MYFAVVVCESNLENAIKLKHSDLKTIFIKRMDGYHLHKLQVTRGDSYENTCLVLVYID